MVKRMVIMISLMAAFIACIGFVKFRRIQASTGGGYQPPPEAVTTVVAREELWRGTLNAIGTVAAVNGVTVSADLPGVVQTIAFGSGDKVDSGQVLVRLDTRQEIAQLVAAEAKLELARLDLERPGPPSAGHQPAGGPRQVGGGAEAGGGDGPARSAPPSSARRSARRSRESSASARSTWAST